MSSKAGLIGLTKAMARKLHPQHDLNAVAPGYIETAMTAELPKSEEESRTRSRWGAWDATEVAKAVVFLASEEAAT